MWLAKLVSRKRPQVATVALANKIVGLPKLIQKTSVRAIQGPDQMTIYNLNRKSTL
jgi:hypothetical protein